MEEILGGSGPSVHTEATAVVHRVHGSDVVSRGPLEEGQTVFTKDAAKGDLARRRVLNAVVRRISRNRGENGCHHRLHWEICHARIFIFFKLRKRFKRVRDSVAILSNLQHFLFF